MRITLLVVGKTDSRQLDELIANYHRRLEHYLPFDVCVVPDLRRGTSLSLEQQKEHEGKEILRQLAPTDRLILLDERGRELTSPEFAAYLEKAMIRGERRLVLVVGGAYGFAPAVYERAQDKLSLSRMTFSHQMVRLFAVEQIYRAMTILRGEPYHHA